MNKLHIMRQPSLDALLRECIRMNPGIRSRRLFDLATTWDHELVAIDFDRALLKLLSDGYRVTAQGWYRPGDVVKQRAPTPKESDPRQLRLL